MLTVKNVVEQDAGAYECVASSSMGEARASAMLKTTLASSNDENGE
jgi:hypothetical protein